MFFKSNKALLLASENN